MGNGSVQGSGRQGTIGGKHCRYAKTRNHYLSKLLGRYERRIEKLPAWNEGSFECDCGYVLERWGSPIIPVFIKLRANEEVRPSVESPAPWRKGTGYTLGTDAPCRNWCVIIMTGRLGRTPCERRPAFFDEMPRCARDSNKKWIPDEDKRLLELQAAGESNFLIAAELRRSSGAVYGRLSVLKTRDRRENGGSSVTTSVSWS
jgi:hypothetical protein